MTNLNTATQAVDVLREKLDDLNISIEDSTDSLRFAYDSKNAYRSAFIEVDRFSSELACKRQARDFVSEIYRKAGDLYARKMDEILLAYEEELTEVVEDLSQLLTACSAEVGADTTQRIRNLLNLDVILASVENIWQERKAEACLNPLQSYLDQVQYEEDRFAETCEDNLFLKQLGKLFRYYGYQARTAIDQLRTDMFTGYLAFRTVFILQSNGHIQYALTEPILALLSEPQEEICHEEDDPLEQTE